MKKKIAAVVIVAALAVGGYVMFKPTNPPEPEGMQIEFGNNSWDALASLEASPAGQNAYVALPLPEGGLGAGNFQTLTFPEGREICRYDLRVTKVNGDVAERADVDLCAATYYHFADE